MKRPLTAGERALFEAARPDHGIDLDRVRICDGHGGNLAARAAFRRGNPAICTGRTIFFDEGYHWPDFSAQTWLHDTFMHEMTHVWQWRRMGRIRFLARYARDLIRVRGRVNDMYKYGEGDRFPAAMIEAQAAMVGHYAGGNEERRARLANNLAGSGFYGL